MKIYESGWIDLKKTIEYIARGTICNTMENFENFVQEGLQNGFPQLYRYIYKDYRGNIRINKNVFKHAEEVVQYLPFILKTHLLNFLIYISIYLSRRYVHLKSPV